MKLIISSIESIIYEIPLVTGGVRKGAFLRLSDFSGHILWGEVAPLAGWSKESLEQSLIQLQQKKPFIMELTWTEENYHLELDKLQLLPSLFFGIESALENFFKPIVELKLPVSALLMGSYQSIMDQALQRYREGYRYAKLKVSQLKFDEAKQVIRELKECFRLRVDVNRAWKTLDSMHFFSEFPLDTFDYIEEPFQNPKDLPQFSHPLAVDESIRQELSLSFLDNLPSLEAIIYKPTIQGGNAGLQPFRKWVDQKKLRLVLSSSFESDLGLANIASMALRQSISSPLGLGTYHFQMRTFCSRKVKFSDGNIEINGLVTPQI